MVADGTEILWQWARAVDDGRGGLALEFEDPAACQRCRRGQGCGAGQFARLFRRGDPIRLNAPDDLDAPHGALVRVGIDGRWLLLGASAMYLAPLLGFLAGLLAVDALSGGSEPLALVSGLAVAAANWVAMPRLLRRSLQLGLRLGEMLESGAEERHVGATGTVGACRVSSIENARK